MRRPARSPRCSRAYRSLYRLYPSPSMVLDSGRRFPAIHGAQVFVLDRLLEEDGVTGDQYGPYDPDFVVSERERQRRDKVR